MRVRLIGITVVVGLMALRLLAGTGEPPTISTTDASAATLVTEPEPVTATEPIPAAEAVETELGLRSSLKCNTQGVHRVVS